jgi:penicillin-binding protein
MENNQSPDKKPVKPNQPKKKRKNIWRAIWIILQVFIVLGLMGAFFTGGVAAGFFASNVKDEPLRGYQVIYDKIHDYNKTGEAYFKNNEFIGYLRTTEVSQPVTENEVSPNLINAILATEDHIFYEHNGINLKAIARAVLQQVLQSEMESGGSTITQQLVKNQILDPSRTFERKFKEMLLAIRVDRMFSKEEILEAYMNIIYLGYNANGSNIEGVKAAAEGIFAVDVKDLNVAQSAYIAGMIHSPGRYTPFQRSGEISNERFERGKDRMKFVLSRMLTTERINKAQYDEALAFNLKESLAKPKPGIVEKYPYLTFEIESRAINILAEERLNQQEIDPSSLSDEEMEEYREHARRELSRGGYKIHTTIDRDLYDAFHEVVKDDKLFGPRSKKNTYITKDPETGEEKEIGYLEQTAATLIDIQTGAIMAMVEGRDFSELQYNLNVEPRQPGSSIKPLLDYAPALELGIVQPASIIDDAPIFKWDTSEGQFWVPKNWNGRFQGLITAREALDMSYNLPAIKTFLEVQKIEGKEVPFDYLRKMGITTIQKEDLSAPSVSIGGMTKGLTVEENTNAFATFANNGTHVKSYLIEKIETLSGDTIYQHETKPTPVFSEQTAFLMNDMLRTVVSDGTAKRIHRGMGSSLDIAGKTGTTNNKFDYWFIGYTPQVSLGVWLGYPKNEELQGDYSSRNQNLWLLLMEKVKEIRPEYAKKDASFNKPKDIVRKTVCSKSGQIPSELCKEAGYLVEDYFNRKYVPTKVDDSLVKGRIVVVDDKNYTAQKSTPDDMVIEKVFIQREPIVIPENLPKSWANKQHLLYPIDWDDTAPQEVDPRVENGKKPEPPLQLGTKWISGGLQISWRGSTEGDIAGYRIYRAESGGEFIKVASIPGHQALSYVDSSVKEGDIYAYQVKTVDISGKESVPTDTILSNQMDPNLFFVPEKAEPSVPANFTGNRTLFGVELHWNSNPETEKVMNYAIFFTDNLSNGFTKLTDTSSTSYNHIFLELPDNYWYYIIAENEFGESKQSDTIKVKIKGTEATSKPSPPDNVEKKPEEEQKQEDEQNTPSPETSDDGTQDNGNIFDELP